MENQRLEPPPRSILDDPPIDQQYEIPILDSEGNIIGQKRIPFFQYEYENYMVLQSIWWAGGLDGKSGNPLTRMLSTKARLPNLTNSPRIPALLSFDNISNTISELLEKHGHARASALQGTIDVFKTTKEFIDKSFGISQQVKDSNPHLFPKRK